MIRIMPIIICFLFSSVFAKSIYQCKSAKGEITFQSIPCSNKKQETKVMSYKSTPDSPNKQCNAQCRGDKMTCIARAGFNNYAAQTTCVELSNLCHLRCNDPKKARLVQQQLQNKYDRELRIKEQRNREARLRNQEQMIQQQQEEQIRANNRIAEQERKIRDLENRRSAPSGPTYNPGSNQWCQDEGGFIRCW